jgi:hypothetical protein
MLTLPDNERIRIFAATAANNPNDDIEAAQLLYDSASSTSVKITTESGGYFLDTATVSLSASPEDAEIRYTLDGSEPGPSSPLYRGSFTIRETTMLKALAFSPEFENRHLLAYAFTRVAPLSAENPGALVPGVRYELYKGDWDSLPDFDRLKAWKTGVADRFVFPEGASGDGFGLRYSGYIDIPVEGIYTFSTTSDDGSMLTIGDHVVVDNDGLHGPDEITGTVALRAGKHPLTVTFFEKGGGESLTVQYEGPGIPRREIGPEVLYRKK